MMNPDDEEVFEPGDAGANGAWEGGRGGGRRKTWNNGGRGARNYNAPPRGNRGYGNGGKWDNGGGYKPNHAPNAHRFGKNVRERGGFVPGPGMTYLSNVEMSCETMVELAAIAKEDDISVFQAARNAIEEYIKVRRGVGTGDAGVPEGASFGADSGTPSDGDVQY